ncbi:MULTISPECIES: YqcC family protein [Tenebrionibacter/Tenebrionicola group]|uniref:YqcC family protein n=2 Tax=Tenebrionibacter/Tenebrionicola group TaxID=2969848 RepID=A0A8K0V0C2_9ENTR|nr:MULTISPECIES: YqcC family protein [Tenebrionibacter/Tenebrionicola group]MBK4714939.1 YqcC family protein [Tenebrionibacter intestinalis]MBV4412693.1 YqcC family protein [Tenebrionicola larvae]MBV5095765.1 YqcC family protein [Tenebrionicola larvae]
MKRRNAVRERLLQIEYILRDGQRWQLSPPAQDAFSSTQPFCMDTLEPHEWLQWVLLPRMHALLDGGHPLPDAFAVAPYYEMALEADWPQREALLAALVALDSLFGDE